MSVRRRTIPALLAGGVLALAVGSLVLGYSGQVAATVVASAPSGPQYCGVKIKVTAQVQESGGAFIADQPVDWTFLSGNGAGDVLNPATSTTNANGIATTYLTLHCSPPHSVTIQAKADDATGTVVVITSGEGLPDTATVGSSSVPSTALAGFAVVLGAGMMLHRFLTSRR